MNANANESGWSTVTKKSKKEKMNTDEKKKPPTNKSTSNPIVKETITIEPTKIGFVAGRQGLNLKRLKKIYGVTFILPPMGGSLITIEGPAQMVSAARKDIDENLSKKTSFFLEMKLYILVIGIEGNTIKSLEDRFNVEIKVNRKNGEVVITGTRGEEAKRTIKDLIERFYEETFSIPSHLMCYVAGKNGSNVKNIESTYGVHIFLPGDNIGTEITIKGLSKNRIAAAKEIIMASISFREPFIIDKDYCHLVIGQKGKTVVALSDKFDVNIKVQEDGMVIVTGKQQGDTEAAKKAIEAFIEELKTSEIYEEKFSVPGCLIGYISGEYGSNRDKIESTYNIHLFLPLANDESEITVKGSDAKNVKAAKEHILEYIGTSIEVNKRVVGEIIGPGGTIIRRLNEKYNVFIKFEEEVKEKGTRKAYILGLKKHAAAARKAIIAIIRE